MFCRAMDNFREHVMDNNGKYLTDVIPKLKKWHHMYIRKNIYYLSSFVFVKYTYVSDHFATPCIIPLSGLTKSDSWAINCLLITINSKCPLYRKTSILPFHA